MSSATVPDPQGVNDFLYSSASTPDGGAASSRQLELNRYWGYYRCQNYAARSTDWNGQPVVEHIEHEAIASQGFIPPGFEDAGRSLMPIKFRRPTAPYYLGKIVTDRFTGLLFGVKRQPKVIAVGDAATTDYLEGIIEAGRFWPAVIRARTYGGGMGTAVAGFSLVDGLPTFEVFDARWCTPKFRDRHRFVLDSIEILYTFKDIGRNEKGEVAELDYYYRRCIDGSVDIVWDKVEVVPGEKPRWAQEKYRVVEHDLGVCPVVWVPNTATETSIDGDPDCYGAYDLIEAYDALMSQANKGTLANCDPTLIVTSNHDLGRTLNKGSDNAIQLDEGGGAQYLEITGAGVKAAQELASQFRERAFELTACVPDSSVEQGPQQTATEVVTRLSRMLERADVFREQYGELLVRRLLEIALLACRKVTQPQKQMRTDPTTGIESPVMVVGEVRLPPKVTEDEAGKQVITQRKLGPSNLITLQWPRYMDPTLDEVSKAVTATKDALEAGLLDQQTAVEYLAQYLPIANVRDVIARITKAKKDAADAETASYGDAAGRWQ